MINEDEVLESLKTNLLVFKRARIYDNMGKQSDMLRVRVLPNMEGLDEDSLPCYAPFNPSLIVKGVSEKQLKLSKADTANATVVWVVCSQDCKIGWILFEANKSYSIEATEVDAPWGYDAFRTHLQRMHCTSDADYEELRVLYTNSSIQDTFTKSGIKWPVAGHNGEKIDTSGAKKNAICLDVVNVRTGERCFMQSTGVAILVAQDMIELRVGKPGEESNAGSDRATTITMTTGKIQFVADEIEFVHKKMKLGQNNAKLCMMRGAPTAVDGTAFFDSNISC